VEPDHLTSLYIPELAEPVAAEVARFVELVATLRAECPWDAEQTHRTLTRHLLEETYEVLEALGPVGDGGHDADPEAYAHLEEELGDLLFQIVFHTTLATEAGAFGLGDVARGIHDKLVHRHPHVFGHVEVDGADEVVANWEQIKKAEKGRSSIFDGMPADLPALLYALKVAKKAATLGVVPEPGGADAPLGEQLLALVAAARAADPDLDPETDLRAAAAQLRDRARDIEAQLPFSSPEPGATPPP
jgi:tetrapyrrole methylase family protein/MazG family protein